MKQLMHSGYHHPEHRFLVSLPAASTRITCVDASLQRIRRLPFAVVVYFEEKKKAEVMAVPSNVRYRYELTETVECAAQLHMSWVVGPKVTGHSLNIHWRLFTYHLVSRGLQPPKQVVFVPTLNKYSPRCSRMIFYV